MGNPNTLLGSSPRTSQENISHPESGGEDITTILAHLQSLASVPSETSTKVDNGDTKVSHSCSGIDGKTLESSANVDNKNVVDDTKENKKNSLVNCLDDLIKLQRGTGNEISQANISMKDTNVVFKGKSNAKRYICSDCGKCCPCRSAYIRHQRIHTGEKPYSCTECGKSFIQSSDYNNHMRSHTGEKPYSCTECGKSFSRSTYLLTHSRTHTKEKPYMCNVCKKSFVQHSHLALHLRIHSGEKPYICIECGNSFSRSSTLVKHKKSHRRKTLHMCLKRNEGELSNGFTQNNPPSWGAASSENTQQDSSSRTNLPWVLSENGDKRGSTRKAVNVRGLCKGTRKRLHKPIRLAIERDSATQSEILSNQPKIPVKMTQDGKKVESLWNGDDGKCSPTVDDGAGPGSLKTETECSCDAKNSSHELQDPQPDPLHTDYSSSHLPTAEPTAGETSNDFDINNFFTYEKVPDPLLKSRKASGFICGYCGKGCPCKSAFLRHQRIHTGEKPYSCSQCGKCFIQSSDYNNHLRSHTGEKPYTCAECGKSFSRSTYLVTHSRTHTKEKPYTCTECGKSFVQHSHLTIHLRIHSGEKPYTCLECGKRFSRSSTLVKHQKSHNKRNETGWTVKGELASAGALKTSSSRETCSST
ncbi:hypothetical protein GDO86_019835 [Hymenochirus boettgeri]|uniref:C2H2-type domain-containing protein n=1 Tax=Hymenochirus boettgeri TaxID=247094 RepID=A0A8T2IK07_9PIPI|nr:hypothetical protein GDO86_019835 [Hymenochirus boettgeri]